ncbi:hypothetical protein GYH30_009103 [Glycine max]|nr:hypothetical protein GYH30_009103 [Glycine max]
MKYYTDAEDNNELITRELCVKPLTSEAYLKYDL